MKRHSYLPILFASALTSPLVLGQGFDISTFDTSAQGPWSQPARTTLMVPKVANGSIKLDGSVSSAEYGGFTGVTVTPGVNAWILDFPGDREWDNEADSSFTFFLSHDDLYLYVGVNAKDDVVNSDDANGSFWKDDAIEIVVDALADRLDNNTDASKDVVGGHSYVNYQGRFSAWNEDTSAKGSEAWASGVPWTFGATADVFGSGKAVAGGWQMEVRFKKIMFEHPVAKNKLADGYRMGFNIGLDDDDKKGPGPNGDKSRSQDLDLQYFWSNRQRYKGLNEAYLATLSAAERAAQPWRTDPDNFPLIIDGTGRLSHGGAGEIIFGYDNPATGKILFVTANADTPGNADPALIALFRARGYTVNVFQSGAAPADFRAAAAANDVVFISETIGSTSVLEPVGDPAVQKFVLRDTDIPVISGEAFMWDNAEWVAHPEDFSNEFSFFGNTGRTEDTQPAELKDPVDSIYLKKLDHPIAKGLSAKTKVFSSNYSLNYGKPSADADIVGTCLANGSFPSLFVYEKGDKLVDGSVVPNKRIALFLGQAASLVANWGPDISFLSEEGKTLLLNTVAYAIGSKAAPSVSLARSGQDVVITYAGGNLESSAAINGPWAAQSGASPLKVTPAPGSRFYRVKAN